MRIEGPEGNATPVERADVIFTRLIEDRRRAPGEDLITALLAVGSDGGEPLSGDEILGFCYLLLVGGNDTTTNLIAFDCRRAADRQLSLGQGAHFCMGAARARLEARVAFEELLTCMREFQVLEVPERIRSVWALGFESLNVEFSAR